MLPHWSLPTGLHFNTMGHRGSTWLPTASRQSWHVPSELQPCTQNLSGPCSPGLPSCLDITPCCILSSSWDTRVCGWGGCFLEHALECQHLQSPGELREDQLYFCCSFSANLNPAVQSLDWRVHRTVLIIPITCHPQGSLHSSLSGDLTWEDPPTNLSEERKDMNPIFLKGRPLRFKESEMQSQRRAQTSWISVYLNNTLGEKQNTHSSRKLTLGEFHSKYWSSVVWLDALMF